jgi:hypothetical protein
MKQHGRQIACPTKLLNLIKKNKRKRIKMKLFFILLVGCSASFAFGTDAFLSKDQIRAQWKQNYCDTEFSKVVTLTTSLLWQQSASTAVSFPAGKQMYIERYQNGDKVKIVTGSQSGSPNNVSYFFPDDKEMVIDRSNSSDKSAMIVPFSKDGKNAGVSEVADSTLAYIMHYSDPNRNKPHLLSLLDNAKAIVSPQIEMVKVGDMNVPCHIVRVLNKVQKRVLSFTTTCEVWLAHENGMLPIKFQEVTMSDANGFVYQETSMAVQKIAKSKNIWYPAISTKYYRSNGGESTNSSKVEILDIQPETVFDPNIFKVKFPKGTLVADKIKGTTYVVGLDDISQLPEIQKLRRNN